jgi:hypothetical protein
VASLSLVPFPQHGLLALKHFVRRLIIGHVGEHFKVICTLAPFSPTPMSFGTTSILIALCLDSYGYFLLILNNYEPDQNFKLSFKSFKLAFQCMPHLLANGLSKMVFEHFRDYFNPKE